MLKEHYTFLCADRRPYKRHKISMIARWLIQRWPRTVKYVALKVTTVKTNFDCFEQRFSKTDDKIALTPNQNQRWCENLAAFQLQDNGQSRRLYGRLQRREEE